MTAKTDVVRTRINSSLKVDYESICETLGVSPSEHLRDLIGTFVNDHLFDSGICKIHICRPKGYDYGVWMVTVIMSPTLNDKNINFFDIPKLENRIFHATPEYLVSSARNGKFDLYANVVEGRWTASLYSNGVEEDKNKTSLSDIKNALIDSIAKETGMRLENI